MPITSNQSPVSAAGLRIRKPVDEQPPSQEAANDPAPIVPARIISAPVPSAGADAATATTAPDDSAKGGEGGDIGLPLSPPSNAAFLANIVRNVAEGARAAICSKRGDPETGVWPAVAAADVDRQCPADQNNYFNCSSFTVDENGEVQARKERVSGYHVLVLDDVGTKVERERLEGVVPSWEIETSPGNSQVGFILTEPLRDLREVERLQGAVIKAGLCDPAAGGAARWMRLPNAINGKEKYHDAAGKPFRCRLVEWHPEATFTTEALFAALRLATVSTAVIVHAPSSAASFRSPPLIGGDVWTPAPEENPVLAALKERGHYKREIAPGKFDVTCPWVGEHTDAIDNGSAYMVPDAAHPRGGFKCQHSHGAKYRIGALLDFLGVDHELARGRARIDVKPGEMNQVKRAAELSLVERGGFYQMGGAIVTIRSDPSTGDVSVERLSEPALTSELADAADWYRFDGRAKKAVRTDPPPRNVSALLRAQRFEFLPALSGVARQPYFRADGTLVTAAGYDHPSGRFGAFDAGAFQLPEPTEAAAREALAKLDALLAEFRFASEADRSAALCAMLTAAVRPGLTVAPAFNITASSPGSGKSYLASTIVPFAGPGHAAKVSYPTTAEEASKAMLSVLASAPAVVNFDDMQGDWKPYGALNRMLTSDTITDRMLGTNNVMTVSTRSLVIGTGNNIAPVRDMMRRVVTIRLHHRVSNPALEEYEGRPAEVVAKARAEHVAAALTIVEAWKAAGSPRAKLPNIASYGEWSDLCRQPLVWLGLPDPATSLIEQINHDPDLDALATLLRTWHEAFGDASVEVRKLVEDGFAHEDLQEALLELPVTDRGTINRNTLGWYLKKNVNRVVAGLELQRVENAHRTAWRVVEVAPEAPS